MDVALPIVFVGCLLEGVKHWSRSGRFNDNLVHAGSPTPLDVLLLSVSCDGYDLRLRELLLSADLPDPLSSLVAVTERHVAVHIDQVVAVSQISGLDLCNSLFTVSTVVNLSLHVYAQGSYQELQGIDIKDYIIDDENSWELDLSTKSR